jgi:hypothetical protein
MECKIIKMDTGNPVEMLLRQLDELTDPKSIHFDQDVFNEREEIKEKILSGEIVCE